MSVFPKVFTICVKTGSGPVEVNLPIDVTFLTGISIIKQKVSEVMLVQADDVQISFRGKSHGLQDMAISPRVSDIGGKRPRPEDDFICPGCGCNYLGNSQYCSRQCLMNN